MSYSDINNSLIKWINPITQNGKKWCSQKLSKKQNDYKQLSLLSDKAKLFSKVSKDTRLTNELLKITKQENDLEYFLKNDVTISDTVSQGQQGQHMNLENESMGELLFLGDYFKPLNFIPYFLAIWATARIYIFPSISMLIPILVFIMPFFILRFMMKIPITTEHYLAVIKRLMIQDGINSKNSMMSLVSFLVTIIQIIVQGYWSFKHLYSIDNILKTKADTIIQFMRSYENIYNILSEEHNIQIMRPHWYCNSNDWRQIIASITLYPVYLRLHLQAISEIDCWLAVGKRINENDACVVKWKIYKNSGNVYVKLNRVFDPSCSTETRVPFDFESNTFTNTTYAHYLLTGPNRGGKSTTLRAISSCIILSHTFGCSLGNHCVLTPIDNLSICLRPDDLPGLKSRFEREVEFAWNSLKRQGTQIILIDEMFHSTNPPDAEEASRLFTEKLWKKNGTVSIISTHLFNFVESAPDSIGRLCCPAILNKNGDIEFSYKVEPGICRVSSVKYLIDRIGGAV